MDQIGLKCTEFHRNGTQWTNWTKIDRSELNGPIGPKWTEINQNGPNESEWTKVDQIGPKYFTDVT